MWGGIPNHFRKVALPGVHIKRRCAGLKNYVALKSQYRYMINECLSTYD